MSAARAAAAPMARSGALSASEVGMIPQNVTAHSASTTAAAGRRSGFGRYSYRISQLGDIKYQALGLFPAEAGVGYRLSVNAVLYLLAPVLDIGFYHKSLYELCDIGGMARAVEYLLCYTDLLKVLFARVRMVGINDDGRVFESAGGINTGKL